MFGLVVLLGGLGHLMSPRGASTPNPSTPFAKGVLAPDERFEFESKHMGTTFRVVLYAADAAAAKKAADAAFARVAELEQVMTDYKQTSELMQLCKKFATEVGEPVKVSADLFAVLTKAARVMISPRIPKVSFRMTRSSWYGALLY